MVVDTENEPIVVVKWKTTVVQGDRIVRLF